MGTGMVPRHMWALEWCPGTYGHWRGAQAHMGTGRVPRHNMGLDTISVPKCAQAPFQCPYLPGNIPVLIRARIPFLFSI